MEVNFKNIDKFTAFTTAFDIQKYRLSKKFNLQFEEMYDVLFDDYIKNIMNKYNPHQAFCYCKKRFNWILIDYLKKKPLFTDLSNYVQSDIEYGKYKKTKHIPKYHTKRLGKPREWAAGKKARPVSMYYQGKHIRDFGSISEATKYMGVKKGMICQAIRRKIKCHNYKFVYIEDKGEQHANKRTNQ